MSDAKSINIKIVTNTHVQFDENIICYYDGIFTAIKLPSLMTFEI
jgi:hypothetical protein